MAPIVACIDDIKLKIEEDKKAEISERDALAVSINLESGMIEKKFFEVFEADSTEIRKTLSSLEKETEHHLKMVREELEKEGLREKRPY